MLDKRLQVSLLCWLCYIPSAWAAGKVHEFSLDNGLKLVIKEDHRAPIVVSQIWYKVGSSYEQEGKTGLSHMLEHMMFKGTQKYPPGEFNRLMATYGASQNAFTGTDFTAYFQTLEKNRLSLSFELEADRMKNLVLNEAEFIKEREVVTEERRSRTEDDPESVLYEHFMATAYQTSPYQNPIIGWMNDIKNLTLADLQSWYKRWYAPNNAIVVVVGDVEPNAVFELAKKYFGPIAPSEIISPSSRQEVEQYGMKRMTVKRPAKLPSLVMGYKTPVLKTLPEKEQWEAYALDVLVYLLSSGKSARLTKHLVREQQIATNVNAGYDMFNRLEELFTFSGTPTEKYTVVQLEEAIRQQIKQLQTTPVEKSELERIKIQLQASKVYELDSQFYQGMQVGTLESIGLDWRLSDHYLDKIAAVTPEQVQNVARKYLIDDYLTVGTLDPQPLKGPLESHPRRGMIH